MIRGVKITATLWLLCTVFVLSTTVVRAEECTFVSLEYIPYACCQNGTLKGLDIEIMRESFHRMNVELDIHLVPWKRALHMVMNGHADGVFGVLKSATRTEKMYFSKPIRGETISLFVRQNSDIVFDGDLNKLKNFTFGIIRNYSYGEELDAFLKNQIPEVHIEMGVTPEMNVAKLIKGRFDILLGDTASTLHTIRKKGVEDQIRKLNPPVSFNNVYVAFSKKKQMGDLRDRFNVALESMRKDGTLHLIMKEYMDSSVVEKGK